MEPKTEKKSIKNEVAKKIRKKYAPRALIRMAWRNVGAGWGGFRRGKRSIRTWQDLARPGPGGPRQAEAGRRKV